MFEIKSHTYMELHIHSPVKKVTLEEIESLNNITSEKERFATVKAKHTESPKDTTGFARFINYIEPMLNAKEAYVGSSYVIISLNKVKKISFKGLSSITIVT